MGDFYQHGVDMDVTAETAAEVAGRLREWMIVQEIILAEETKCGLGPESMAHPPGKHCELALKRKVRHIEWLSACGVDFRIGRAAFWPDDITELVCSNCGGRFELNSSWGAAYEEWESDHGPGVIPCEHCGTERSITQWEHDPVWGFGILGITFWNWPALSGRFIQRLSEISGHRFRYVWGHL